MPEIHVSADAGPIIELAPDEECRPLDLVRIFKRVGPLEVDLGCGDGTYLAQLAEAAPAHDFLGVERLLGRVRSACFKLTHCRLTNARIVQTDTVRAVTDLLPVGSVDVFHVMFPDPWPKRRHHNRRLLNQQFLELMHRTLRAGGRARVVTDHANYFDEICAVAARKTELFAQTDDLPPLLATSTFEQRFRDAGLPIYRLMLRKLEAET